MLKTVIHKTREVYFYSNGLAFPNRVMRTRHFDLIFIQHRDLFEKPWEKEVERKWMVSSDEIGTKDG